jgi:hypothetical protein
MQIAQADSGAPRLLTETEIEDVGGAGTFGEWVGRISVWTAGGGVGAIADAASGGALSSAAASAVGRLEDWVNGK